MSKNQEVVKYWNKWINKIKQMTKRGDIITAFNYINHIKNWWNEDKNCYIKNKKFCYNNKYKYLHKDQRIKFEEKIFSLDEYYHKAIEKKSKMKPVTDKMIKLTTAKYKNRPAPPYSAGDYCGRKAKGNDANIYISTPTKGGFCVWKLIK
jgi:hypothetical protein